VAVDSPVLLVQGLQDTTVVPERTRDLFARMCGAGQVTHYSEYDGADHGNIGGVAAAEVTAWLQDRLAGAPASSSCAPTSSTTAHFSAAQCRAFDLLAAATGTTREEVVRGGVQLAVALAALTDDPAWPAGWVDGGPCAVTLEWAPDDLPALQEAADAYGVTLDELHHGGGRVLLAVIWALAARG